MAITYYDPDGTTTAGNSLVAVVPAVADIRNPTLSELDAGTAFECATESFGSTTKVKTEDRKKLCDKVATQKPGKRSYEMEDMTIVMEDPQAEQPLMDKFTLDGIVYLIHRPGVAHLDTLAAGQKVQIIKAMVMGIDLEPLKTDEGQEYEFTVQFAVQDRTDKLVEIVA